jgi:hypothetical protein
MLAFLVMRFSNHHRPPMDASITKKRLGIYRIPIRHSQRLNIPPISLPLWSGLGCASHLLFSVSLLFAFFPSLICIYNFNEYSLECGDFLSAASCVAFFLAFCLLCCLPSPLVYVLVLPKHTIAIRAVELSQPTAPKEQIVT